MTELLILYILTKGQNTMYGLSKSLCKYFGTITKPGFGTIQPALKRLEKKGVIKSDRFFSDGGKPYYYYSIQEDGKNFLKKKIFEKESSNPVKLIQSAKIKIACSDILEKNEKLQLFEYLKTEILKIKFDAENALTSGCLDNNFCHRMITDNIICEYSNFVKLIEGLEHACNS